MAENDHTEKQAFRLIVHIGAGKTGSSSIQATLQENTVLLSRQSIFYLGLMLEHAPAKKFAWQFQGGADDFFARKPNDAQEEIYAVLSESIPALQKEGVKAAIWSNEWMFGRHLNVLPALERLRSEGVDVRVIAYVRRHDSWVRSAYLEWGIKFKTYEGPIRPFPVWRKGRSFSFYPSLKPWLQCFEGNLLVRNFDVAGDVVADFFNTAGVDASGFKLMRENESPDNAVNAIWLVFNSRFDAKVPSWKFMDIARAAGILNKQKPPAQLKEVLPSDADLQSIINEYSADRELVNELLRKQGQAELDATFKQGKSPNVDPWELNAAMMKMLFALQEEVVVLRKKVFALETKAGRAPREEQG